MITFWKQNGSSGLYWQSIKLRFSFLIHVFMIIMTRFFDLNELPLASECYK